MIKHISACLLMLSSFLSTEIEASRCVGHPDIWGYVDEAEYIFSAVIVSISSPELERRPPSQFKTFVTPIRVEMEFDPTTVVRGNVEDIERLVTWYPSRLAFHVGQSYHFFVQETGEITNCSGTYELSIMEPEQRMHFLEEMGLLTVIRPDA